MINLKNGERIDDLQRNGLKIIQNPEKFCFGIDAVLLSHFAKINEGDRVIDLGTGTGILPILLSAKTKAGSFVGLEIQEESAEMATRSVLLNNLEEKISIVNGDIKECKSLFKNQEASVVVSNPPYMINDHGLKNDDEPKAIARHEIKCDLKDVVFAAKYLLKNGGKFYLVHRPFRLVEIFTTLSENGLEPKRMQLVHPYIDHEPNMVLIEAVKGGKSRLKIEKPLVVYEDKNKYTREIYDIYGF